MAKTFTLVCIALFLVKCWLTADMRVSVVNSANDDLLYVSHAAHLLDGKAFGSYNERTLLKLPGFPFALAAIRTLGVPYLFAIQFLLALSCFCLATALRNVGISLLGSCILFALFLFHPLSLSHEWQFVMRESLSSILFIALFASMLATARAITERRFPVFSLLAYSAILSFCLILREEDRILWLFHPLWLVLLATLSISQPAPYRRRVLLLALALPCVAMITTTLLTRNFIQRHYGAPILHDIGEGEYPALMATLRRVYPQTEDLHETLTVEAVRKIEIAVPELKPLLSLASGERVPNDEGTLLFRFREHAMQAGHTPNLIAAQSFYRENRLRAEKACLTGALPCGPSPMGVLPPLNMHTLLRFPPKVAELWKIIIDPQMFPAGEGPFVGLPSAALQRDYEKVTMTTIPATQIFSNLWKAEDGSWIHRSSIDKPQPDTRKKLRRALFHFGRGFFYALGLLGWVLLLFRFCLSGLRPKTPLGATATAFVAWMALKIGSLAFVSLSLICAVRLYFPIYFLLGVFGAVIVWDTATTWLSRFRVKNLEMQTI